MVTIEQVIRFLEKKTGFNNIQPHDDLDKVHGIYGDDWDEMMEAYAKEFNVDCSGLLWYFHTGEEGLNFPGRLFFKTPDDMGERIPVTPAMLTEFANKGKWDIQYPPHELPKIRKDLFVNCDSRHGCPYTTDLYCEGCEHMGVRHRVFCLLYSLV